MVEENEIRAGLSFYERARIAARAAEQGAFETPRAAAKVLFKAAPRAKRSKIYSFLDLYGALDDVLQYPSAMSEKLGLQLAKLVAEGPSGVSRIKSALKAAKATSAAQELEVLGKIGSNQAKSVVKAKATSDAQPEAGIVITSSKNKITLSGQDVSPALEAKLRDWIAQL